MLAAKLVEYGRARDGFFRHDDDGCNVARPFTSRVRIT
jgi:hypothetical protein